MDFDYFTATAATPGKFQLKKNSAKRKLSESRGVHLPDIQIVSIAFISNFSCIKNRFAEVRKNWFTAMTVLRKSV